MPGQPDILSRKQFQGGVGKKDIRDGKKHRERQRALQGAVKRHFMSFDEARLGGFNSTEADFDETADYTLRVRIAQQELAGRNAGFTAQPTRKTQIDISAATEKQLSLEEKPIPEGLRPLATQILISEKLDTGKSLVGEQTKAEEGWIAKLRKQVDVLLGKEPSTPDFEEFEKAILKEAKKTEDIAKLKEKKDDKKNFPELSPEAVEKVRDVLSPGRGTVVDKFQIAVQKSDIATLRDGQWLNDEVINFYGSMIMERAQQNRDKYPNVHFFNTNFFSYMRETGYKAVQRWTRRFDIFAFDIVLIPVHWAVHWCFAAINFKKKRFEYYDSLHGPEQGAIQLLRSYCEAESMDKKKKPFDFTGWEDYVPKNIPSQKNGYDCGVFTCIFAEYSSREEEFDFSQAHMKYLRNRMIYEIVNAKLMLE